MRLILSSLAAALLILTSATVAADEPTLEQVRSEALRYAELDGRLNRWSGRARLRHLIPRVTATVGEARQNDDNSQYDEWLTHGPDDLLLWDSAKNQTETNRRRKIDYTIRADVELGGLIFDNHELAAARESRARHEARVAIVAAVHLAYSRRRAQLAGVEPCHERLLELEAELDGLTGGWFSAQLRGAP